MKKRGAGLVMRMVGGVVVMTVADKFTVGLNVVMGVGMIVNMLDGIGWGDLVNRGSASLMMSTRYADGRQEQPDHQRPGDDDTKN